MKIIKSKILSEYEDLIHGVSSKIGLSRKAPYYFNLSFSVGDEPLIVEENRKAFFNKIGINGNESGRMQAAIMMKGKNE